MSLHKVTSLGIDLAVIPNSVQFHPDMVLMRSVQIKPKLSLELSPGYRYNLPIETVQDTGPTSNSDVILRTAARFSYKIHEYTSLNADLTAENGSDNNTLTLDASYKNLMFKDWAFKIGVNVKYTEVVPEGAEKTDTITTFNLLYTFE